MQCADEGLKWWRTRVNKVNTSGSYRVIRGVFTQAAGNLTTSRSGKTGDVQRRDEKHRFHCRGKSVKTPVCIDVSKRESPPHKTGAGTGRKTALIIGGKGVCNWLPVIAPRWRVADDWVEVWAALPGSFWGKNERHERVNKSTSHYVYRTTTCFDTKPWIAAKRDNEANNILVLDGL